MAAEEGPIEILKGEHNGVLEILDKLEEDIDAKDIEGMDKSIWRLEKEFDRHSLNKEEKVLFPVLEKFLPREGGPTAVMIAEHEDLVGSIKNFKEAVGEKDFEKLNEIGRHIILILRDHINKENNILFRMAEMHLDEGDKKSILSKFRQIS